MGVRYLSKERENNLIAIHVYGHGCMDNVFTCEGKFNTSHKYSDGFKPDEGWYRIADYSVEELKKFKFRNVTITYSVTCEEIKENVESVINLN